MKLSLCRIIVATVMSLGCLAAGAVWSQSYPTASRGIEISAFGGPAGVFTGLAGGHNLSLSAGVDIGFRPIYGFLPALEVRGLYPFDSGSVDKQENGVGGLRLEKRHRAARVYGDILFGRGKIDYLGGFLNPAGTYLYYSSTSNVISPGVGVAYDFKPYLAGFVDAQFQHYDTPATVSGSLWSKPVTIGVVYRLPFERHGRPYP